MKEKFLELFSSFKGVLEEARVKISSAAGESFELLFKWYIQQQETIQELISILTALLIAVLLRILIIEL